jgi:hypothetical protein
MIYLCRRQLRESETSMQKSRRREFLRTAAAGLACGPAILKAGVPHSTDIQNKEQGKKSRFVAEVIRRRHVSTPFLSLLSNNSGTDYIPVRRLKGEIAGENPLSFERVRW